MKAGSSIVADLKAEKERAAGLAARLEAAPAVRKTNAVPDRSPAIRKGENSMSSRPFMFSKIIGFLGGVLDADECKVELENCDRLKKAFRGSDHWHQEKKSLLAPFGTSYMPEKVIGAQYQAELREMVKAGFSSLDLDEMNHYAKKSGYGGMTKAQSWLDDSQGGSLVGPPEFGELIELFRNRDALITAGATVIPLPPTGRIKYPRQTAASTGGWLGENANSTDTTVGTGDLTLSAKKCVGTVLLPNELLRFGTVAAEALVRLDLSKTLSLTMDKALLDGGGGDNVPLGLLNTPGVATITPTSPGTNGDTVSPQDLYSFAAQIEANNGEMSGYIMRPEMFYNFVKSRSGVYNGSAVVANGQFNFNQMRDLAQSIGKNINGFPVTTTPQISQTRAKGSGSNLTYIVGGMWSDLVIAMFGGVEFLSTAEGYTLARADQTYVRAVLSCDGGAKHPGVFGVMDNLIMSSIGV